MSDMGVLRPGVGFQVIVTASGFGANTYWSIISGVSAAIESQCVPGLDRKPRLVGREVSFIGGVTAGPVPAPVRVFELPGRVMRSAEVG